MRYFRLAAIHSEQATGIGIDHIADLLNGDEATVVINDVRAGKPDRLLKGRENIHVKRRSVGEFRSAIELGNDAIARRSSITEVL